MRQQFNHKLLREIRKARNIGFESEEEIKPGHKKRSGFDRRSYGRRVGNDEFEVKKQDSYYGFWDKAIFATIAFALISCTVTILVNI